MTENKTAIQTAAAGAGTPEMGTPPAQVTLPETPTSETSPAASDKFENGGALSGEKIQWVAIGIFTITIVALVYKAMYYRKAMTLLSSNSSKTDKKLQELEKNIRAVRRDKYEAVA